MTTTGWHGSGSFAPASCERCQFFNPGMFGEGECRLHPPVIHLTGHAQYPTSRWPIVTIQDWCGDWIAHPSKGTP